MLAAFETVRYQKLQFGAANRRFRCLFLAVSATSCPQVSRFFMCLCWAFNVFMRRPASRNFDRQAKLLAVFMRRSLSPRPRPLPLRNLRDSPDAEMLRVVAALRARLNKKSDVDDSPPWNVVAVYLNATVTSVEGGFRGEKDIVRPSRF